MTELSAEPSTDRSAAVSGRVLFITRKWGPAMGGMETYCEKLVEHMAKRRPIDVIALPGRADRRPPTVLSLLLFPFKVIREWCALKQPPAIIHLGDMAIWPLALLAMIFARDAKIILSAHGTDISFASRKTVLGRLYKLYQSVGTGVLRRAGIIANSKATAKACRERGWRRVSVCALATDIDPPFHVQSRSDTILFAGRLIAQKGLSWFVQEVLPQLPDQITLDVAGIATEDSEAAALDHPRVRFLGPLSNDELAKHYASALCVVVPNIDLGNGLFEGFGLIAPEAASAGGVVLAAKTGGLPDAVIDGETGFLIASGQPQQWTSKIAEIANWSSAQRTRFVAHSKTTAKAYFNWGRVALQTDALYEEWS